MSHAAAVRGGVGPLGGIRVLEFGTLLAGSFAARTLGDFGADVIKVEAPVEGDPLRDWGQVKVDGRGLWWPLQSRNKRLVTLDLRTARGQELARMLLERTDVLIENFRPGTLERWGLGPGEMLKRNPGLIVARISGYGQTGPYAARPGFASVGEAMGGIRYVNGHPGEPPPRMGISLGDSLAAMFSVQGVLMALVDRDRTGLGQVVDTAISESSFALMESAVPEFAKTGHVREPSGTRLDGIAPSNIYRSRDGKWVVIAANADTLFARLCAVMGRAELASDERYRTHTARGQRQDELDRLVGAWAAERDAADIDRLLNDAGVVCGPVYTVADIFADPQFQAREMFVSMEDAELGELVGQAPVPKLSRTPGGVRWAGPWPLGSHNREVYCGELGLSGEEYDTLLADGII